MNSAVLWPLWFVLALGVTLPAFSALAQVFLTHSPAPIASSLPAVPVVLAAGAWVTHRFRQPRWELALLVAIPASLCLTKAPLPTLLAAALFLSAHTIGRSILPFPPDSILLRLTLRFGLGIGVFIVVLFCAGIAGVMYWPLLLALLLPALSVREFGKDLRLLAARWAEAEEVRHPAVSLLLFFGLGFAALGALWALTPEIAYDPLKMHFASARWYAETGTFTPVPNVPESYYPQGAELLMALLWSAGGQSAAQLLSPIFFLGTLLAAASILRALGWNPAFVFCGLVAAASVPFLHWTAFVAKNDIPLAFFLLASLACLLHRRVVLASFFLAMAFGIKHVALFGAIGLTPLFVREIWLSRRRLRTFLAVAAVFLAFGTFSLLRTYVLTGNPLYPENATRTVDISVVTHPYQSASERVMRYAGIPWLLHFDGQRAFESSSPNPMGFWLVFFVPVCLAWFRDRHTALRLLLLFCAIYLLYWVSILVTLRYALAPILLLIALTAPALFDGHRRAAIVAAFYSLVFSLAVCTLIEVSPPQLLWWAGRFNTDTFLRHALPIYPASQALHGHANKGDGVLALNGCPTPYAPFPGTVRCLFDYDFQHSAPRLIDEVQRGGYRFLILPATPLSEQFRLSLPTREIYSDSNFGVYVLSPR
ncbi:MAG: DUF2029 domain-containing protein [Bryobacterales bacterium]|nr:DUF2029 domain-containing protein [Bryobacterales bacterium]